MTEDQAIEAMARAAEASMFAPHELPVDPELHEKYKGTARDQLAAIRPYLDAQFAAGAEALREASFQAAVEEIKQDFGEHEDDTYNAAIWCVMDAIRALPIPARGDGSGE